MKSLPLPVAQVRSNFSDVLDDAGRGKRIRVTRHGKPVGWIIGAEERAKLDAAAPKSKSAKRARARR
jgi:prevent-host-death family protein